jgi:uncharacterized repeat protein (TIGR01451 family)
MAVVRARGGPRKRLAAALLFAMLSVLVTTPALADPVSPLTVTNVDSADPVSSGSNLLYTITVVNTGGSKVTNVVLTDQLNGVGGIGVPPQLVLSSSRGSCTQSANLVTCNVASIEGGGTWTVTIQGVVTAANGTTLNNTASVTCTKSAQNFTTTATATTAVGSAGGAALPDLTIAKTGPTSVTVSTPMTYTLTVNNIGTANATGVKVVDTVPAGLTNITATGTSLFNCSVSGQTVTCTDGAINQGSNATITINATSPALTGTITNTAAVDPDIAIAELNELNNTTALVSTQVTSGSPSPSLSIQNVDAPDPVTPGQKLTYIITVTNNAATRADDVVVVDGTQGLTAASITASQVVTNGTVGNFGGCTVTAPQIKCSIRTLNPGGTLVVTISGQVVAAAGSTILDTATVTGNISNKGVSSTASAMTTVRPAVDLTVTIADSPDPVCARSWPGAPVCGGGLKYTFVVGNSGISTASGVALRATLPPEVALDSYDPGTFGTCGIDSSFVLLCTGGMVGPASTTTVTIVLVAPPITGVFSSTVTVDPDNAIFEADETNNSATQTTTVSTGVDLTVAVTGDLNPVATSGTETYTITVDNIGPQDVTGVRVRDVLPSGTIFRSAVADPNHGFTCSESGGVVECVGGSLKGTARESYPPFGAPGNDVATITVRVFARSTVGSGASAMHNEVRVDPLGEIPEVNEANNVAFIDTAVASGGATMGAFNELTIAVAQLSPANPAARNAIVTYQITVGNDASDPAVNVAVRDFLPAGSRFIDVAGTAGFTCTQVSGIVDCTGGGIPAAGTATITIRVFAPDTPGQYTNTALVDPNNTIPEGNEFDNQAAVVTTVVNGGNGPFNDLQIAMIGTPSVTPGAPIDYRITVANAGSDPASNVAVRDLLPAGVTFVFAQDDAPGASGAFSCGQAGGVVDCTGATIAPGAPRNINIRVNAPSAEVANLTNQAFVDPNNTIPEGDELNNSAQVQTQVRSAINLRISKTGPSVASQSTTADYVLKVRNDPVGGQGQTAFGVQVHDPMPVGLIPLAVDTTPKNGASPNNWACQISENPINVVDCVGDLNPTSGPNAAGDPNVVTITITVFVTAESGRSLDNEACVDPNNTIVESEEHDNCSTFSSPLKPKAPDLLVNADVDPTVAQPGDTLTYTITLSNVGTADAPAPIKLTDTLPAHVTFVDASGPNQWTCSEAAGVVTCNNPAVSGFVLPTGATATFTIHVTVKSDAAVPLVNTATAAPVTGEDETSNNTATVSTSVGSAGLDLAITSISDNPDPVNVGELLTYTIIGINGGTQATNGVHVSVDIPPTGVTFVGADGSNGFNCKAPVSNTIDCSGDLPAGGNTVITVKLVPVPNGPPDLTLSATIDPTNAFAETDEGNNSKTEVTTISGTNCTSCVDLVAADLIGTPNPVKVGQKVTFELTVLNTGDTSTAVTPAAEMVFFDLFGDVSLAVPTSSNPNFVCTNFSHTSSALKSNCTGDGGSATGELGPGEGVTFTLTVTVNSGTLVTGDGQVFFSGTEFRLDNNQAVRMVKVIP